MKSKIIIVTLIFLALGLPGVFTGKNSGNEDGLAASATAPLTAEDLIGQSAMEVKNPQVGRSNNAVVASQAKKIKLPVICQGSESQIFNCYQKHYKNLVKTKGVQAAFADLRQRYNENSYVVSQCHPITHVIGDTAVEKYPTASEAYLHGDSFCWSGYYHGVLEGILSKIGMDKAISEMNNICKDIPGKSVYSFDYYNCVHGLGHGLMAITDTELFKSLNLCDGLSGSWEQTSCYGGVFMENVIVDNKNHFTKYLKPAEPLYPCNTVDEKYKSACYLMQTSYMLKVSGQDFAKVFALCEKADKNYIPTCYQSLGRDASGHSISNVISTKNSCYLGKDFYAKSNCIIGAVKDFISYFHSDVQAKTLCNSLTDDLRAVCLSTATDYYKTF
ncbi:MAG: hypothetical protein Q7S19_01410 [bacterium]|nr:hypothetical protein [bacterium]